MQLAIVVLACSSVLTILVGCAFALPANRKYRKPIYGAVFVLAAQLAVIGILSLILAFAR